jgi:hypothetical protein
VEIDEQQNTWKRKNCGAKLQVSFVSEKSAKLLHEVPIEVAIEEVCVAQTKI